KAAEAATRGEVAAAEAAAKGAASTAQGAAEAATDTAGGEPGGAEVAALAAGRAKAALVAEAAHVARAGRLTGPRGRAALNGVDGLLNQVRITPLDLNNLDGLLGVLGRQLHLLDKLLDLDVHGRRASEDEAIGLVVGAERQGDALGVAVGVDVERGGAGGA